MFSKISTTKSTEDYSAKINKLKSAPKPVYEEIFNLVKDKDYFVITTNVDHCFQNICINADLGTVIEETIKP